MFNEKVSVNNIGSHKVYQVFWADYPVWSANYDLNDEDEKVLEKGRNMFATNLSGAVRRGFF